MNVDGVGEPKVPVADSGNQEERALTAQADPEDASVMPETTYTVEAIELMDAAWDRLYDIWLHAAEQHADTENRSSVQPGDVRATIEEATKTWLEESTMGSSG